MHADVAIPDPSQVTSLAAAADAWWGALALAGSGVALAALLRATRSRRAGPDGISAWAIAAGLVAATILGPAVAGRAQQALYERFIGGLPAGSPAASAVDAAQAELRAATAAESAIPSASAIAKVTPSAATASAMERVQLASDGASLARHAFASPRHVATAWLAALLLLLCMPRLRGIACPPGSLTVAAWSAALPGLLGYALMRLWAGAEPAPSAAVASAFAIGATFPTARPWRAARRADGTGGALCAHSGAWAWPAAGLALAAAIAVAARMSADGASLAGSRPMHASTWIAVSLTCIACIAAPAAGRALRPRERHIRSSDGCARTTVPARGLAIDCVTAALVALAAAGADPIHWNWMWTALAFGLVAEDGRCLAAWAACVLQGTHTVRDAARVGAIAEESSRPMVALASTAAAAGLLAPSLFAAIAAGALAVDVTWSMRRLIALAPAQPEQRVPTP